MLCNPTCAHLREERGSWRGARAVTPVESAMDDAEGAELEDVDRTGVTRSSAELPVARSRTSPPHLVVILVDDLGWHNVGFHNDKQISPNIDALMRSGAELRRHYTYRFCSPSRSALLSGRLPIHVNELNPRTIDSKGGIDLRMTLLPSKLKRAGYFTATVGSARPHASACFSHAARGV